MKARKGRISSIIIILVSTVLPFVPGTIHTTPQVKAAASVTKEVGVWDSGTRTFTPRDTFDLGEHGVVRIGVQGRSSTTLADTDSVLAIDSTGSMTGQWCSGTGTVYRTGYAYDGSASSNRAPATLQIYYAEDGSYTVGTVNRNQDDAQETATGSVATSGNVLSIGQNIVGFYFAPVNVPRGAVITEAYLHIYSEGTDAVSTSIMIYGQNNGNPAGFTTGANNLSNRLLPGSRTSAAVTWNVSAWNTGQEYWSPDISSIVSEIVALPSWPAAGGNPMVILLDRGTGLRQARAYDRTQTTVCAACVPQLNIDYIQAGVPQHATVLISASRDDAQEDALTHATWYNSWQLDPGLNFIGLRFLNIPIAQGATITNATITFQAGWGTGTTNEIRIFGQDSNNPAQFSNTANNISSRIKTSFASHVSWYPADWTWGNHYTTPNLSSIVSELVNKTYWSSGRNMVFILENDAPTAASSCIPKMTAAKNGANQFLDMLNPDNDYVGALSFSVSGFRDTIVIESPNPAIPISNDYAGLRTNINAIVANGSTPIGAAVSASIDMAQNGAGGRAGADKYIVLLTDGQNTYPCNWPNSSDYNILKNYCTFDETYIRLRDSHIPLYAIGIGDAFEGPLKVLAEVSNDGEGNSGRYYYASDPQSLNEIYQQIANEITSTLTVHVDDTINVDYFRYDSATGVFVTNSAGDDMAHNLTENAGRITGNIGQVPDGEWRYIYIPFEVIQKNCLDLVGADSDAPGVTNQIIYRDDSGVEIEALMILNANINTCPIVPDPWFQSVEGRVHANGDIFNAAVPAGRFIDENAAGGSAGGLVTSRCNINPNDARSGARIENYDGDDTVTVPFGCSTVNHFMASPSYSYLSDTLDADNATPVADWSALTGALIAAETGRFITSGSLTINSIPAGFAANNNLRAVVFVNGDLNISTSFTSDNPSTPQSFLPSLAFIVSGNINITGDVANMYGLYLSDGLINTLSSGIETNQLKVFGSLIGRGGFTLGRDLGGPNQNTPAEQVAYMSKYLFTLGTEDLLGVIPVLEWKEE